MELSNVAQLVVPQTLPLERREHVQGVEREAEFLSLRLLNKRARVRVSPSSVDYSRLPGKSSLLAVANKKAWLAAAIRERDNANYILISTLSDVRSAFESGQADAGAFIPLPSRRPPFPVPGTPTILKFALNDERLVVGFLEGPILVYDTNNLFATMDGQPPPIFTFPGDASTIPRDILPNPGDSPELVAIMRGVHGQEPGHQIDVVDVQTFKHVAGWRKGSDPNVAPVSISWSPKGKQIAIGLQSGDMLLYSPLSAESPKSHLFKPPSIPPDTSSLLSTTWLSNPTFHTVYSTPEASSMLFDAAVSESPSQTHFISTHDSKSRSALDVELRDPCPPFGARRPPGPLSVVLRNWNPAKFIIFCAGGASSDIGVIGTLSSDDPSKPEDQWVSFNLEETSTPSLPLDEELNDLALLGLDVDLTSSSPVRMSEQPDDGTPDLPPAPVLYAYTSDGTISAWHILNTNGEVYPGMTAAVAAAVPSPQIASQKPFAMQSPTISPASPPREPSSVFNRTPATSASSVFGQASSPSAVVAPAQGFGAFANVSSSSSKFGATGFGFAGGAAVPSTFNQPSPAPAFGTTGFGSAGQAAQQQKPAASPAFGTSGFGQAAAPPAFGVSAFGSKPAAPAFGQSGFGAAAPKGPSTFGSTGGGGGGFASFANKGSSAFGAPVDSAKSTSMASPTFGQSSFGQTSAPFGGQSAFGGQASTLTSAFGSGGVGQAKPASPPPTTAFGQQAQSAFGGFGKTGAASSSPTASPRGAAGLSGFGALGDALEPSVSPGRFSPQGSPPSPAGSLPESPELRPTAQPAKAASSYLKPAEGFGALNKPSQGFGAFGGGDKSSTSAFLKPAEGFGVKAFSQSSDQQTSTPATAAPTFGATSKLGQAKPMFGTSSFGGAPQKAAAEPSKPIPGGGFGAFSSGGGGFASFANAGKTSSFADILSSSGEQDKPKPETTPLAFGGPSSKATAPPAFGVSRESGVSSTPAGKPTDVFSRPTPGAEDDGSDSEKEGDGELFPEDKLTSQEPSTREADASFSLLSLGTAASQIALSKSDDISSRTAQPESVTKKEEASNEEAQEEEEETASEPLTLSEDGLVESASSGEEEQAPRSVTRSPTPPLPEEEESATPQDRIPPPPEVKVSSPHPGPDPSSVAEASTTPPGSPQGSAIATQTAPVAPTPALPVSTTPPFGLGLGRPSSRPIRSSPLASSPVTSADDEQVGPEESPSKSAPPTTKTTPSEPLSRFGQRSPQGTISAPPFVTPEDAKPPRPKTPPLLATRPTMPAPMSQASAPGPSRAPSTALKPSIGLPTLSHGTPVASPAVEEPEEESPKHPMQIEFLRTYQEMTSGLAQLDKKAQDMALLHPAISEPRGLDQLVQNNQDFVPAQYSHGDLKPFTTMIGILEKKVVPLLELGNENKRSLRELQNLVLISETKQEEVVRWARAREDPNFANSLKPSTLGPEDSENQLRLRKAVQMVRDRLQQFEDEMESLKKRLEQHKSGKVGIRPPSLDTIDRTCRNIQLALEERMQLLQRLHDRVEALPPKASQRLQAPSPRTHSPGSSTVTPPFASVAAAALNHERASLRLKNALLSARKEPLLTTEVTKLESKPARVPLPSQRPEWKLPPVPPLDSSTGSQPMSSTSRRSARVGKRHGAVQLKESSSELGAKTVAFDWGPLPGAAPLDKLSDDVRNPKEKKSWL